MDQWRKYTAPLGMLLFAPVAVQATEYLTVAEAQHLCFPSATVFEPAHIIFTPEQIEQIETRSGEKVQTKGQQMWRVKKGDELLGYFLIDSVIGKHLAIDYAVALDAKGSVAQVEIMEYRESYGGEIRRESWRAQFAGKTCETPFKLNNEIFNISGATLSCRHVTDGIRRVLATFCVAKK